jgi:hypothetical protein
MAKRARKRAAAVLGLGLAALVGCSLVVDTSDINEGCGEGYKPCFGHCVSSTDPAFGCADGICSACRIENAIAECQGNVCAIKQCVLGFGCGERCETNLFTDEQHCGTCDTKCASDQLCANGVCITPR